MSYQFIMPKQIFYGEGALEQAAPAITGCGRKALIVTDPVMVKLKNVEAIQEMLAKAGVEYAVFEGVTGEPTDKMVEAGLAVWEQEKCDFLIAVGGGSPIDTMKAIGVVAIKGGSINDWYGKEIAGILPPMTAVPTTSGTGSEATQFTIITNTETDIKMLLKGRSLMPDIAVDDPRFTMVAPAAITAAAGLDALCHAAESYTSRKAQPMTDTLAVSAVKRIFKYLPICYSAAAAAETADNRETGKAAEPGMQQGEAAITETGSRGGELLTVEKKEKAASEPGMQQSEAATAKPEGWEAGKAAAKPDSHGGDTSIAEARMQMSLAALEAGIAFNNASVTVIHGMSRPIGALFHVPHGISNAMLLSACFEYVYLEAADRFAVLAKAIGAAGEEETDPEAAEKFIRACRELCKFCHIPTLEEYGIDREAFLEKISKMTRDALASGSPANTRKELCEEDIAAIYKSLLVHPLNTN
jgi:alcohol dehydrogenase class IV